MLHSLLDTMLLRRWEGTLLARRMMLQRGFSTLLCLALHRCDANDDVTARCCDAVTTDSAVHAGLGHRCAAMQSIEQGRHTNGGWQEGGRVLSVGVRVDEGVSMCVFDARS